MDERERCKTIAARLLMKKVLETGDFKQKCAEEIARLFFDCIDATVYYRGRRIIGWVNQILRNGSLSKSKKGYKDKFID
jgi:hypothetical protein